MNKPDLVEYLVERHELTRAFARELVDDVLGRIVEVARQGEPVTLYGFGTFKVAERAARKGRNPRTGEPVKIAASKTLKFAAAGSLKASFNKKRRAKKG
jgi:DNA-binding protein HU-beta